MNRYRVFLSMLILVLAAGCNLPRAQEATPTPLPSQDLTVTALYQTAVAPLPTETPRPAGATATQLPPSLTPAPALPTPTQLPTSTHTPLPPTEVPPTPIPPTPTVPYKRGGFTSEAVYLNPPPVINGDWSEWKGVAREYPAQYVVYGSSNWSGENDLNASYYVGWDANYFYVAVKVRDDVYAQNSSGANIYKGDSFELLIDTNVTGDYYVQGLNSDDFQIGFSPGRPTIADGNPEAYLWFPSSRAGSLSSVKMGAVYEGTLWRMEAAVPWSVLGITPFHGMHLGFALSASDNDLPGEQVQQSMVSSVPNRHLTDPTTWGDLLLK
jgi:hypothetical protein